MKRITLLLAFIGMISLQSCTTEEIVQENNNYFVAPVFERTVSFTAANGFSNLIVYPNSINPIYPSDMVLAYRLEGVTPNGDDIWRLMPQTIYFADGTRDFSYEFNFTMSDIEIYMDGNDLGTVPAGMRNNQVFRVVIVPADFTNRASAPPVDYKDYNAVAKALNIDESKILKN